MKETFDSVTKTLSDACELAPKQPIPGKRIVLMKHSSFRTGGYALMIPDKSDQKINSKRKTYAPWRSDPKSSPLCNSRCLSTRKTSWQFTWLSLSLHTICGEQQSQQITNQSSDSSKRKQFHQLCGTHVTM